MAKPSAKRRQKARERKAAKRKQKRTMAAATAAQGSRLAPRSRRLAPT